MDLESSTTTTTTTSFEIATATTTTPANESVFRRYRWQFWGSSLLTFVLVCCILFMVAYRTRSTLKPRVQLDWIKVNGSRSDPFGPTSNISASFSLTNNNGRVSIQYDYLLTTLIYNGRAIAHHERLGFTQHPGARDHVDADFTLIYTWGPSTSLAARVLLVISYRVHAILYGYFSHTLRIACGVVVAEDPYNPKILTASSDRCKTLSVFRG